MLRLFDTQLFDFLLISTTKKKSHVVPATIPDQIEQKNWETRWGAYIDRLLHG